MTRRARIGMFLGAAGVLGVLFVWAFVDLPSFGHYRGPYGYLLNRIVPQERHVTEVVGGTVFDVRGFDTLGEEYILFVAVAGIMLLLRSSERGEEPKAGDLNRNDGIRVFGTLAVAAAVLVGLWIIAFGYVTPGGGFQGGVAVAAGVVLLWLVSSFDAWEPVPNKEVLDPLSGIGAGGYVVLGLAGLAGSGAFLANLFGPGRYGTLQSGGSIPFVNWAAGIEVAAALLLLFGHFIGEYVAPLAGGGGT